MSNDQQTNKLPCKASGIRTKKGTIRCRIHGGWSTGPRTLKGKLKSLQNLKNINYEQTAANTRDKYKIVKELMNGTPLTRICNSKDLPSLSKVYDWIAEDKEFANKIMTARKIAAQTYLDRMIEELDTADNRSIATVRKATSLSLDG